MESWHVMFLGLRHLPWEAQTTASTPNCRKHSREQQQRGRQQVASNDREGFPGDSFSLRRLE